ncbi:hypothetical protein, partial [Eisenbergiella sp. OF01-20]|uniref:hypothetical protein n=1 Tax=Eisenbergiella sp. OF01-20 TaxID=2292348 RepID=UPI001A9ACBC5
VAGHAQGLRPFALWLSPHGPEKTKTVRDAASFGLLCPGQFLFSPDRPARSFKKFPCFYK